MSNNWSITTPPRFSSPKHQKVELEAILKILSLQEAQRTRKCECIKHSGIGLIGVEEGKIDIGLGAQEQPATWLAQKLAYLTLR